MNNHKISLIFISILYVNICLSQTNNDYLVFNRLLEKYFNLQKSKCNDEFSANDEGYIMKLTKTNEGEVQISISTFYYFDEVKGNCNTVFQFMDRWCFIQYDIKDSIIFNLNLNSLGIRNQKQIDSIAKSNFSDPGTGEYLIYYPFLIFFNLEERGNKILGYYVVYFPENKCPDLYKINRNYHPNGTKYYPRMESLNKKFKRQVAKKTRICIAPGDFSML
jgi:hypothetical protein